MDKIIQFGVFLFLTLLVAFLTWRKCAQSPSRGESSKDYFLANGGLSWVFIAGSITLTNLSTDQLVGMNGNQMALLALWELSAVVGLFILAKVFVPIYYKYKCTTTTELLEKRYNNHHIRATVGTLFLLGNVFIYLPAMLYSGSLFMQSMFQVELGIMPLSIMFALVGAAYSIFGGLRAVAVSDTYSGIGLLAMGMLVVFLSLKAIGFDFSGIPAERLTLIGDDNSPIPWHTLLTGMLFIQIFYWSTNQTITQRAMAAPTIKEAQRGVLTAAVIRLCIVPAMVVIPGIAAYKLYGQLGDATYGHLVGELMPHWMSGAFAAVMAAAVLTSFNSVLNSSAALYVCDIHEKYFNSTPDIKKLSTTVSLTFVAIALVLVPVYSGAESIINLLQQLNGLLSMPILSAFITGLIFRGVDARSVILSVVFGTLLYAFFTFGWAPFHYIHMMFITLLSCVAFALFVNRFVFKKSAQFVLKKGAGDIATA
ncbi:SLC5 family protein [Sansalvadorimonas verongulae]|uniref:SLC5 family protein n=1 Tax=Sansalvadorimonas verongulae TaxID=2172824 RepID=UPI0012BC9614|nr:SLC5 family protein [Sansalvadorimonas verongulae]